ALSLAMPVSSAPGTVLPSFHLAMLGHAGAVLLELQIAPGIFFILRGPGAALANGGGASPLVPAPETPVDCQCSFTGGPVRCARARARTPSMARTVPLSARSCIMRSDWYMIRANRPSTKMLRPSRKPIRLPTVLHLPSETSEPKSRYV